MKIRDFLKSVPDLHGVADWHGDMLLVHAAKGAIEGAREFAGIFDQLRAKGFNQRDALSGALDGAEHLVQLAQRGSPHAPPVTSTESARAAAINIAAKIYEGVLAPKSETPTFASLATKPDPAKLFEDSLTEHERKCSSCRDDAYKKWNAKQGVK